MSKTLLVYGEKTFKITVDDDCKITFGPWSPPTGSERSVSYQNDPMSKRGTLRIYKGTKDNIIAVFAGVTGFRDVSLDYVEQVAREEGATIWRSDERGYERTSKGTVEQAWVAPDGEVAPKRISRPRKR